MRQTHPITNMAMMLALCQPLFAVAARVQGTRINEIAAERSSKPMMSSSYQRLLKPPTTLWPAHGDGGRSCNLAAFLMFRKSIRASGVNATGRMEVQMP